MPIKGDGVKILFSCSQNISFCKKYIWGSEYISLDYIFYYVFIVIIQELVILPDHADSDKLLPKFSMLPCSLKYSWIYKTLFLIFPLSFDFTFDFTFKILFVTHNINKFKLSYFIWYTWQNYNKTIIVDFKDSKEEYTSS